MPLRFNDFKLYGFALLLAIVLTLLTGCDFGESSPSDPDAPGGVGMTYNGKLGFDYGTGFVQPFDGSRPGLGFGY